MWPFNRTKRERIDPHQHHDFQEPSDVGLSAAASGSAKGGINIANVIGVTAASMRTTHCAVPGCGKIHNDPIHMPAEE